MERVIMRSPASPSFLGLVPVVLLASAANVHAAPVSFRNDVMAVLSKAGCNQGACHGNFNGKGGFKLSLRGQDPVADFESLTRDMLGRRIDAHQPAASLILAKATAFVPHEGGRRFAVDAPEYGLLFRWLREGARPDPSGAAELRRIEVTPTSQVLIEPADRVQLRVKATYSDGSVRDVTRLAVYEPSNTNASVSMDGEAERQRMGETAILVRYLDQRATVQLAFVPARAQLLVAQGPREQLHRPPHFHQAQGTAHAPVGPLLRQRLSAAGLPRHDRPGADGGRGAGLPRRPRAGQARPPD
jgi:hypothetical protein